jgi:hypothetical protein
VIQPLGLPVYITDKTRKVYDTINNLPKGSAVLYATSISATHYPETQGQVYGLFRILLRNKLPFLWICEYPDTAPLMISVYYEVIKEYPDAKYGVDYVMLGYIPGMESGLAGLAKDTSFMKVDYFGNALSSLPLMSKIKTGQDFKLVIALITSDLERYFRQFQVKWGTPIVEGAIASVAASMAPYYMSGQLSGYLNGTAGAAEFEALIKKPGVATRSMDALSISQILCLAAIALGNGMYFASKRRAK